MFSKRIIRRKTRRKEHGLELPEYAVGSLLIAVAVFFAFTPTGNRWLKFALDHDSTPLVLHSTVTQRANKLGCEPTETTVVECPDCPQQKATRINCGQMGSLLLKAAVVDGVTLQQLKDAEINKVP